MFWYIAGKHFGDIVNKEKANYVALNNPGFIDYNQLDEDNPQSNL